MTFKEFKKQNKGGYATYSAYKMPSSFFHEPLYGDCDDMVVVNYLYQPLNGIYTVYLK